MKTLKCAGLAIILIATVLSLSCGETHGSDNSTPIGECSLSPTSSQPSSPEKVVITSPFEAKVIKIIDKQTIEAAVDGKTITITFPAGVDLSKLTENSSQ